MRAVIKNTIKTANAISTPLPPQQRDGEGVKPKGAKTISAPPLHSEAISDHTTPSLPHISRPRSPRLGAAIALPLRSVTQLGLD